jgi:hypothetical protein
VTGLPGAGEATGDSWVRPAAWLQDPPDGAAPFLIAGRRPEPPLAARRRRPGAPTPAVPGCPGMDLTYTCEGPDVYLAGSSRSMTRSPIGLPTMVRIARLHQPCIVVVGSTTALGR